MPLASVFSWIGQELLFEPSATLVPWSAGGTPIDCCTLIATIVVSHVIDIVFLYYIRLSAGCRPTDDNLHSPVQPSRTYTVLTANKTSWPPQTATHAPPISNAQPTALRHNRSPDLCADSYGLGL
jgi:hypothetical protein